MNILKEHWLRTPYVKSRRKLLEKTSREAYDFSQSEPSIISNTCIGGIIYHLLGLEFKSPTINLWMTTTDFVKFVCNFECYLSMELLFDKSGKEPYPVGLLEDIKIHFNHYKSEEDAGQKWNVRKKRIDFENLYIICDDNGLSQEEIFALRSAKCKRLLIFTADETKDEECFFYLKKYKNLGYVGNYSLMGIDGLREFEKSFNFSAWLNGERLK